MFKANLYLKLMRPDNWFKNVFVFPGFFIAILVSKNYSSSCLLNVFLSLIAVCLVSSANYVLNEWLDREFDKFHPEKRNRPSVANQLEVKFVVMTYLIPLFVGLGTGFLINEKVFYVLLVLSIMGVIYNVNPLRSKDKPYLDVLSESINNPLRFLIGWWAISASLPLPPITLLITYWFAGAYLMNIKRYSEFRFINDKGLASLYRSSFKYYTEESLLMISIFYAIISAACGTIFLVKYKIELLLVVPFVAGLYTWYFFIGLKKNSAAQHPEHMYKEKGFILYTIGVFFVTIACFFLNIPLLKSFLQKSFEF